MTASGHLDGHPIPLAHVVMADVAAAAGVSQKTVSRVVNGSSSVSPQVRERVMQEIARLGYRRNGAARALVTRRTHVIGIVTMGSALHGVTKYTLGVERAARAAGFGLVIVATEEGTTDDVPEAVERALALGAEGLVMIEPRVEVWDRLEAFGRRPFVTPGPRRPGCAHHVVADTDQELGARLATEHLLDLGHASVAHLPGPSSYRSARRRLAAWREVLQERGVPGREAPEGDWSARSGYTSMWHLLGHQDVTAVFVANDHMAIGAMRAIREAGLRIPEDISVVGFDDVPEAEFLLVPLTTVRQDFDELSRASVTALVEAIETKAPQEAPVSVPVELVVRASTAAPSVR